MIEVYKMARNDSPAREAEEEEEVVDEAIEAVEEAVEASGSKRVHKSKLIGTWTHHSRFTPTLEATVEPS